MRALVIGYFSTVGDLEVLDVVGSWLDDMQVEYDVSAFRSDVNASLNDAVDWREADPKIYTHLLITCGPFSRDFFIRQGLDLGRFRHCVRLGVNLSMIAPLDEYDPLDALVGRDSNHWTHPDISFLHRASRRPVVGLCLAPPQREYGDRQLHAQAGLLLREAARQVGVAVQVLDTRWPEKDNDGAIDSASAFESIIARVDVVLTTRLHGAVIALKNGVPAVVVDPVRGGDKVLRQMEEIGWPRVRRADEADVDDLAEDLRWCLSDAGPLRALRCAETGRREAGRLREVFTMALEIAPRGIDARTQPLVPEPTPVARRAAHLLRRYGKKIVARLMRTGQKA